MAGTTTFETLMRSVFRNIGLEGLSPDSDGMYGIDVDGEYNVHIGGIDDHLLIFSKICDWDEVSEERRKALFEHNVPESGETHPVVTLDTEGTVFVWMREPLKESTPEGVVALFQVFMDQVDERRDVVFKVSDSQLDVHHGHMGIRA